MREKELLDEGAKLHWIDTSMPMFMRYSWYIHNHSLTPLLQNKNPDPSKQYLCDISEVTVGFKNFKVIDTIPNKEDYSIPKIGVQAFQVLGSSINESVNRDNVHIKCLSICSEKDHPSVLIACTIGTIMFTSQIGDFNFDFLTHPPGTIRFK